VTSTAADERPCCVCDVLTRVELLEDVSGADGFLADACEECADREALRVADEHDDESCRCVWCTRAAALDERMRRVEDAAARGGLRVEAGWWFSDGLADE
jgi:hypothetical protein